MLEWQKSNAPGSRSLIVTNIWALCMMVFEKILGVLQQVLDIIEKIPGLIGNVYGSMRMF